MTELKTCEHGGLLLTSDPDVYDCAHGCGEAGEERCSECGDELYGAGHDVNGDLMCSACADDYELDGCRDALDAIAEMLRDPEWGVGMLEDIAEIVKRTGRTVENYEDERSTWERH